MPNYLTDQHGKVIESTRPLPVRDVGAAHEREAVSAESVTLVTGAAGFSQIVALDKAPIASLRGDKVGSFWRLPKNRILTDGTRNDNVRARITGVVETAGSATVTITDSQYNLEQLFEETVGTRHHVIEITDSSGDSLYGWIGAITATGNSYVISIHNASTAGAQSWVGTLADFTFTNEGDATFSIYSYESSFVWVTATILTREVEYKEGGSELEMLDVMANGDFAIDYQRARILYKKATAGTSDTCNYSVLKKYVTLDGDVQIGAVEIKDNDSDTRAVVDPANGARVATSNVILVQTLDENGNVVGGSTGPGTPQANGFDATGQDAYATIVTTTAQRTHLFYSLGGANDAEISLDGGATAHFRVPANSSGVFDDVLIANAVNVQARNATAGSNYTNLIISVW